MAKQIIRIPNFAEGQRCFYPVRADSYYKGCNHNCIYCFSRAIGSRFNKWEINNIEGMDIVNFQKLLIKTFENNGKSRQCNIIRSKIPLRLGGITDSFQPCEIQRRITLELIKLLNSYDYPYLIVTKSSLVSDDEYLKVIRKDLAYVQISITTLNNEYAKKLEPNASTIKQRLQSLQCLINEGIYTAARVSPLIPIYPDGSLSHKIYETNQLSYFSYELIEQLCSIKPNTILIEFLRVSPMIKKILIENNMHEILKLYNNYSEKGRDGTLHFSLKEKECYCEKIYEICKQNDIDFSICEDREYDYFKKYWANKLDCCNALNKIFKVNSTNLKESNII